MDRILIAAGSDKHVSALVSQLKEIFPGVRFSTVSTGRDARRVISEQRRTFPTMPNLERLCVRLTISRAR